MDGTLEISTTLTIQDRIEAALWVTRGAHARARGRKLFLGVVLTLAGCVVGLLAGWAGGTESLLDVLRLTPAMLRTPFGLLLAILLTVPVGRYVLHNRLGRRRIARWIATEQGAETVSFVYRIDASGVTVEDAAGSIHVARAGIAGLDETAGAFYIRCTGVFPSSLIMPKHDVVPAVQDRVRAALSAMAGDTSGPAALAWTGDPGAERAVELSYDQTREDLAASLWQTWNTPSARRRRAWVIVAVTIGVALTIPAFATLDWLLDSNPDALATLIRELRDDAWKSALVAVALGAGSWILTQRLIRRQALALAASQAGGGQPARFALGPHRFVLAISHPVWRYGWQSVRGYCESADHVFLKLRFGQVIPLPRRAFDPPRLAAMRRLVAEHGPGIEHGLSS